MNVKITGLESPLFEKNKKEVSRSPALAYNTELKVNNKPPSLEAAQYRLQPKRRLKIIKYLRSKT